MRILIADNDLASGEYLVGFLSSYGECDLVADGLEAMEAFLTALDEEYPYGLICLDLTMPKLDGLKALKIIRELEQEKEVPGPDWVKIIITSSAVSKENLEATFARGGEVFAVKPIDTTKLTQVLKKLGLS